MKWSEGGDIELAPQAARDADRSGKKTTGDAVTATRVGLRFPGRELEFQEWRRAGAKISRIANASAWYLGDWVAYGEAHYEDRYRHAVDAVGLSYQTLRNYAWVSRRFAMSRRRDTLTFHHHMEVAKFPGADQDRWLDRAEEAKLSVRALRREIASAHGGDETDRGPESKLRTIQAEPSRVERWRAAASLANKDLDDWIVTALDEAAKQGLSR
ncbi:LmbU family transcriptional regulator [Amycolatopsis sp. cmx-11-51]|uniref:LmbU family transcriptional regulator n=1 Tax=unclassified Amycolatopsis TaxID=2618356 RepID=UPI0039E303A8